jgi:ubiquinone/menaquinone biosynthesis C-methylase UbiE
MTTVKADFTTRLLVDAGIREGMRVLDVGCGSGDVTFLLAGLLGQSGAVVGIDHDAAALTVASQRAVSADLANMSFARCALTELPGALGKFDAIVGRRVLMYQADAVAAVRALTRSLNPGGVVVFQEHDTTMVPACLDAFPLHRQATRWIQQMIEREGADLHIGFNLHRIFRQAGLDVEEVRAECVLQTPDRPYGLGHIVRACLPRIVAHGVATADEIDIETLQARLDTERAGSTGIYVGDMAFGAWARKPLET